LSFEILAEMPVFELGKRNELKVLRESPYGVYLDTGDGGGILLPKGEVPEGTKPGDKLRVFIYLDTEDQEIATLRHPKAELGQFARLKVTSVTQVGAFLDWGLQKDLFLPFGEQQKPVTEGLWVNVFIYIDNTGRLAATTKTDRYLETDTSELAKDMVVEILPWRMTDIGMLCIINDRFEGLIHRQDLTQHLSLGKRIPGYIKQVRDDGRVGLMLQAPGYKRVGSLADQIVADLEAHGGVCSLGDKSDPVAINDRFGCSKKAFKMAIGQLLKEGKLAQDDRGIRLL
jgi:predicted RNA-binding protein (virulence factor B family)